MSILDAKIARLDGSPGTLGELTGGQPALLVNVASECGLTPQYTGLERLHEEYAGRGFTVVGLPCNQFGAQEPGSAEEIAEFCSSTYGVTFPMSEKIEVNGPGRHEVYRTLVEAPDEEGRTGDIAWNFEKFLVDDSGNVLNRFSPRVEPGDERITAAIESALASRRRTGTPEMTPFPATRSIVLDGRAFELSRAAETDVPDLVALLADDPLGSARESTELGPYLAAFHEIHGDDRQFLVAARDGAGTLVGTMQLTILPGLSRGGATRLQIEAVRVAAAVRGSGLGAAMFEWAHEYGRHRGATIAQLTSDKRRADAHRFYARLGYEATHQGLKRAL